MQRNEAAHLLTSDNFDVVVDSDSMKQAKRMMINKQKPIGSNINQKKT
jgi:hypothetical protein